MEEVKLQQVFKRHQKNEDIRVNCWTVIGEKFGVYQNEVLKIQEQRTVVVFFFLRKGNSSCIVTTRKQQPSSMNLR